MGSFHSDIKFVSPPTRVLNPSTTGTDLTLTNDLIALGGVSIGNSDNPLAGQLKLAASGGAGYLSFYDGVYREGHIDGSTLYFDISGAAKGTATATVFSYLNITTPGTVTAAAGTVSGALGVAGALSTSGTVTAAAGTVTGGLGAGGTVTAAAAKIGTLAGLLKAAGGTVSALAVGAALQIVRVNSGATDFETADVPSARVYHNTTQSASNGMASTFLQFNSNRWLTGVTQANGNATNSRLVAPVAGKYKVGISVQFPADTSGSTRRVLIFINNATTIAVKSRPDDVDATDISYFCFETIYSFAANEYVEFIVAHNASGSLTIPASTGFQCEAWMVRVG